MQNTTDMSWSNSSKQGQSGESSRRVRPQRAAARKVGSCSIARYRARCGVLHQGADRLLEGSRYRWV